LIEEREPGRIVRKEAGARAELDGFLDRSETSMTSSMDRVEESGQTRAEVAAVTRRDDLRWKAEMEDMCLGSRCLRSRHRIRSRQVDMIRMSLPTKTLRGAS